MARQTKSRYFTQRNVVETRLSTVDLPDDILQKRITLVDDEDLLSLAWEFLGDAQYFWVLAEINNIINSFTRFQAGDTLLIPDKTILERINAGTP